jgi:hypothetical protein
MPDKEKQARFSDVNDDVVRSLVVTGRNWSPGTDMRSFVDSFLEECSLKQISGSFMQRML